MLSDAGESASIQMTNLFFKIKFKKGFTSLMLPNTPSAQERKELICTLSLIL